MVGGWGKVISSNAKTIPTDININHWKNHPQNKQKKIIPRIHDVVVVEFYLWYKFVERISVVGVESAHRRICPLFTHFFHKIFWEEADYPLRKKRRLL